MKRMIGKKSSFPVVLGLAALLMFGTVGLFTAEDAYGGTGGAQPAAEASAYRSGQALWVVLCNESISLRAQPSTASPAMTQVPLYDRVTFLDDAGNGFFRVSYNGRDGYVLARYLDEFEPQIAFGVYKTVVGCRESITLRSAASVQAAEICQIPLGAKVYVVRAAANKFYQVEYNGHSGYALALYLD